MEISDIIQKKHCPKKAKSTVQNSLPTKLLKQTKEIISPSFSKAINNIFNQGIFPTAFKIAKVVPIFKSES